MKPRVARRLARRAARRDPPGRRGRRALRHLGKALDRRDPAAFRAVWQRWLDTPSSLLRELLSTYPDVPYTAFTESYMLWEIASGRLPSPDDDRLWPALAAALSRPDHPVGKSAAALILAAPAPVVDAICARALDDPAGVLARFCLENGLVPAGPVDRAVFLARTGQGVPDTPLLAAGYADADLGGRRLLRTALAGDAGTDLVRVVRTESRPLIPDEIDDLAAWLTSREDWTGLWRLVVDVSPAAAVELVRRFPDPWHPSDPAGRRLFDALAATPPEAVTAWEDQRLPVGFRATAVSFAPDGTQIAILGDSWVSRGGRTSRIRLVLLGLPGLEPLGEHRWRDRWAYHDGRLLHLGPAVIRTGYSPMRCTVDSRDHVPYPAGRPFGRWIGQHRHGWTSLDGQTVYLGSHTGPEHPREIGIGEHGLMLDEFAVEPGTGEFVILGREAGLPERLVLFDRGGRKLAERRVSGPLPRHYPDLVAFTGPGRLITTGSRGGLALWHRAGDTLELVATADTPKVYRLHVLPAVGKVVLGELDQPWYSTDTLLPARPEPIGDRRPYLWTSPDGRWTATPTTLHRLAVPIAAAALIDRPQADMRLEDLAVPDHDHPAVRVVRACLEHRFGVPGPS